MEYLYCISLIMAKRYIFDVSELVTLFVGTKESKSGEQRWWKDIFSFDLDDIRPGKNNTKWASIKINSGYQSGDLTVKFRDERHSGFILPIEDEDVAVLSAKLKKEVKKRDRDPMLQITKWTQEVQTEKDKITVKVDEDGNPIYPADEYKSELFRFMEILNEVFIGEVEYLMSVKKIVGKSAKKEAGSITAQNSQICSTVQTRISVDATGDNAGKDLPNPISRIKIPTMDGKLAIEIYDRSKKYIENKRKRFEIAKIDGEPINNSNIHKWLIPGALNDGILNCSLCISNMGISCTMKVKTLVTLQPPPSAASGIDSLYSDEEDEEDEDET
jgi:hypothetical protein